MFSFFAAARKPTTDDIRACWKIVWKENHGFDKFPMDMIIADKIRPTQFQSHQLLNSSSQRTIS